MATVLPEVNFDGDVDCKAFRKAMKGIGTDEAALINILCKRSWQQRVEIKAAYRRQFGKELAKELAGETSGNFQQVLERLLKTPVELAAFELRKAMKGAGTDETCLIEIICTKSNQELREIDEKFKEMYNRSLSSDVASETSGYFQQVLLSLLQCNRPSDDGDDEPDFIAAALDATALYEAGENQFGTDESRFISIICNRSYRQLKAIFDSYRDNYKKDIIDVIKSEFSGDIAKSLLAVVAALRNRPGYFAESLHSAMKGLGTNDRKLLRIIVAHCDFDLEEIKSEYLRIFGKKLCDDVHSETSGDYRHALLALLGSDSVGGCLPTEFVQQQPETLPKSDDDENRFKTVQAQPVVAKPLFLPETRHLVRKQLPCQSSSTSSHHFNVQTDCINVQKALMGVGKDESALIDILCKRSCEQRLEILKTYQLLFDKDLLREIAREAKISDDYYELLKQLFKSPVEQTAVKLREAVEGGDKDTLIEIICCTKSNKQLQDVIQKYREMFDNVLERDVENVTDGYLKTLLIGLLLCDRPANNVDSDVEADAKKLFEEANAGNLSCFLAMFCGRSYRQLEAIFECYKTTYQKDITDAIEDKFSGDIICNALFAIVAVVRNLPAYFAQRIHWILEHYAYFKDVTLMRFVVAHADSDLQQIKSAYLQIYANKLSDQVFAVTSGLFRTALITLIGPEQSSDNVRPTRTAAFPRCEALHSPMLESGIKSATMTPPCRRYPPLRPVPTLETSLDSTPPIIAQSLPVTPAQPLFSPLVDKQHQISAPTSPQDLGDLHRVLKNQHHKTRATIQHDDACFNVQNDCKDIHKAVKGIFGADKATIIRILCNRTWQQRVEISRVYEMTYGEKLAKRLAAKWAIFGKLLKLLETLLKKPVERDVMWLHELLLKNNDSEETRNCLVDILCTKSTKQLNDIKEKYQQKFNLDLTNEFRRVDDGDYDDAFSRLLFGLLTSVRPDDGKFEPNELNAAKMDADSLFDGNVGENFISIVTNRSYGQLKTIIEIFSRDVDKKIEQHFRGSFKNAALAIVGAIRGDLTAFYAGRFRAVLTAGTMAKKQHKALVRLIVSRCDIDLEMIKAKYEELYGETLLEHVKRETSSADFRKALLTLLGERLSTAVMTSRTPVAAAVSS